MEVHSHGMRNSINRDRLEQVSLEDEEFRDLLIGTYLEDARAQVAGLSQAATESDDNRLTQAAHRLKGASANLGAEQLADLCAEAERHGKGQERALDLTNLLQGIRNEFQRVQADLQGLTKEGWN